MTGSERSSFPGHGGKALALVQNYDNHKNIYKPEVLDSKLISRDGNDFKIFLRLLKKKIITVVLDTDHDVHYLGGQQALVLPLLHHSHRRGGRSGDSKGKGAGTRHRIRISVAAVFLLALSGAGQRRVRRVPGRFADPRHPARAGMDHRTDHPQAAARVFNQHPQSHARRLSART